MAASRKPQKEPSSPRGGEVIRPRAFQREVERLDALSGLVAAAREGVPEARRALFDRFADDVERLLYRVLGRDPDIADALQDVFLQVFRNLGRLRDPEALPAWLRAITVATAKKRIRARARRRWLRFLPQEELPEPSQAAVDEEVLAALDA
ncbi:MAG: sigma-70 family RNA polymerase sigma factor, partial [Myxococcales bacterium]|nr:sigma-70 family RNA polymerase sigma factor [Myxococcales bacterium]